MGEERVRRARLTELSGGDLDGFRVGRRSPRQRRRDARRDEILLPSREVEGLTGEQRAQLLALMRRLRDEVRAGARPRRAVDFVLTEDGRVELAPEEEEVRPAEPLPAASCFLSEGEMARWRGER